ncbi:MAG: LptF/LptG family permease [Ignavibacteriae bacterium]|nr:LptF/LptG family permease [Ignavibacteriota bacterium]
MLIYRYILKSHIGPFVFSLGTLIFLFLFQFLMKSIDQLIGKGLSIWIIVQLIVLNLAWMLTLAVPMSVLVATLMAFGSLSSNNEVTIMKASGISLMKLMLPVVACSIIITYLMILFNNDVLPEANHKARVLLQDISKTKPTFLLESGKFSDDIGGAKIFVRKTFENSNELEGVYIYDFANPNNKNLITAKKGDIAFTNDFRNIVMNLENGEIHQLNNLDFVNKYRKVEFTKHRIILDAAGFGFHQSSDNAFIRGDRELSAQAMNRLIDSINFMRIKSRKDFLDGILTSSAQLFRIKFKDTLLMRNTPVLKSYTNDSASAGGYMSYDSVPAAFNNFMARMGQYNTRPQTELQLDKQVDMYNVEIYKKYSIPFACLIFTLIGAPLGYKVRRGGFGIAAGLSLFFFLLYWASLIGGEKLADRDIVSPFWGMWIVNIILGIFGLYLMFKSS